MYVVFRDRVSLSDETSHSHPDRPWGSPILLYNGYLGLFPGDKAAGAWRWSSYVVPRLKKKSTAISPLSVWAFIACSVLNLTVTFTDLCILLHFMLIRNQRSTTMNWVNFCVTTSTKYSLNFDSCQVFITEHSFYLFIIHNSFLPSNGGMRRHSNQEATTEIDVSSFIGIPCIPLAQSFHAKHSHWSFASVICMLRGNGISHIKFLREGGGLVRLGWGLSEIH